jgi:hypothetical protein
LKAQEESVGRVNDIYFDDEAWSVRYLVAGLREKSSWRQVLVEPAQVDVIDLWDHQVVLSLSHKELQNCDPATSVRPVCKQYEFMGMATPGSLGFQSNAPKVDPHLRSAKAVLGYTISVGGEDVGVVRDLVLDQTDWSIRYLQIEQQMDNRIILFHVVPSAVKRISWVANRVFLRDLSPVQLQDSEALEQIVLPNENTALASAAA